jgi:hypothetical protein
VPVLVRKKGYSGFYLAVWTLLFLLQVMIINEEVVGGVNCYKRIGAAEAVILMLTIVPIFVAAVGLVLFVLDLALGGIERWRQRHAPQA